LRGVSGAGTAHVNTSANVSTPKENKNVSAGEPPVRKQRHKKAKLIRLDDLLAKGNVRGGAGQLLFGATNTTQPSTQNTKEA
jgi:hypothetical protein